MPSPLTSSPKSLSLLVVDDNAENRFTIRRLLRPSTTSPVAPYSVLPAFSIEEADTGNHGIALCRKRLPDCLLLSHHLGDTDSSEFLAELNSGRAPEDPLCPVVVLTGAGTEAQVAAHVLKGGAEDYLIKENLTAESLVRAVTNAIAKVRMRRDLRESEARFRTALDRMPDCFASYTAVVSAETGHIQDFRCDYVNDIACQSIGLPRNAQEGRLVLSEILPHVPLAIVSHGDVDWFGDFVHVVETGNPLARYSLVVRSTTPDAAPSEAERIIDVKAWKMGSAGVAVVWRDVTKAKKTQADLQYSGNQFRQIVETAEEGIWTNDEQGRVTFVNSKMEQMLGYTFDQMVGRFCGDFADESSASEINRCLAERRDGIREHYERMLRHRDGSAVWVAVASSPTFDAHGVFNGTLSMVTDISERKKAEKERQESERRNRIITEITSDFGFACSVAPNGHFTLDWIDESCSRITGYSIQELKAGWRIKVFDADRAIFEDGFHRVLAGETVTNHYRLRCKEGTFVWLEVYAKPFWSDADQRVTRIYGACRDITERKSAEQELRLMHRALEQAQTGILIADAQQEDTPIIYVNPGFSKITGYAPEDVLGRNCRFLHRGDSDQEDLTTLRDALAQGQDCHVLLRNYKKDGILFWNDLFLSPLHDQSGVLTHFVAIQNDITERKRMEHQMTQSEKLSALGALVAGVAHEINNPLTGISGYAQLMEKHVDTDVRDDAASIQEMVTRISRILRSLRNFARPSEGLRHPVSLNGIVNDALNIIKHRLRQSEVVVVLHLSDSLPLVSVGQGEIEQVLVNLLGNAEYALRPVSPRRKEIQITTSISATNPLSKASSRWCVLTVVDNGCGIHEAILGRIFDPFFTTKEIDEGTGLGLSISHKIIADHGGTISVASQEGKGTTLTVHLPALNPE